MAAGTFGALLFVAPAGAVINGPCSGSGTFRNGLESGGGSFTVDASTGEVITVPLKDDVAWEGAIAIPARQRPVSGWVRIDLPWPLGGIDIDTWGKDGRVAGAVDNSGTESYDLPSVIPRGVEFRLEGEHHDVEDCSGYALIQVEGAATDSWAVWPALVLTIAAFALTAFAGKRRFRRVWVRRP